MRLIAYLKDHILAVVLVFCLLMVQAFTDLSLPNLTSDIVDVGIQQSGIEHASAEQLSSASFEALCLLADGQEEELIRASYDACEGTYALNDDGRAHRDELDSALSLPMAILGSSQGSSGFDLRSLVSDYESGKLDEDALSAQLASVKESFESSGDSLVSQQAVAAVKAEYASLGVDVSAIQLRYLLLTGAQMLGLVAIGVVASILVGFLGARTGAQIAYDLRSRMFKRVVSFSEADINKFSAASLITRATNDVQQVQTTVVLLMRMVLYSPIVAIGGIVMVLRTNASMGWVIVVAVVIVFALVAFLFVVAMPKFRMMQKLIDKVNLVAREMLTGLPVIRAFGRESYEEARFDEASTALFGTQLFTNRVMTFMMPCMTLIMNCTSVAIVWIGGHYVDVGAVQTGDLIAFITYSMVIIMSFLMIGMVAIALPRANVAAGRIDEVLSTEPSIVDPQAPRDAELVSAGSASTGAGPVGARVDFDDVSFAYDADSACAVSDVSFTALPGQTVGIIGATGSGKSTLCKLLMRFYDVSDGSVRLDGIDVRELSQHALRSQIGYVPQKAFLFSGTVAENVAYSDESMGKDRVERALSIAQASDFVSEMPEGASSAVSQGGTNVSGGQRQRLAIARALAARARVYVFDDSFSALDYKTDAALRRELAAQLSGATVIIVAQRIATIMQADRIVVIDEGRVVGQGTHEELLDSCKTYQEIALSQLSPEELKGGAA